MESGDVLFLRGGVSNGAERGGNTVRVARGFKQTVGIHGLGWLGRFRVAFVPCPPELTRIEKA